MRDKYIIKIARAISLLFTPFYFPVIAFLALFMFSYKLEKQYDTMMADMESKGMLQ